MFYYSDEGFNMECYNVVRALRLNPDTAIDDGVSYLSKMAAAMGLDISSEDIRYQIVNVLWSRS